MFYRTASRYSPNAERSAMPPELYGVDLFAGAGGMSIGAVHAGVDVLAVIEIEPNAASTYASNHVHTRVINDDVRALA